MFTDDALAPSAAAPEGARCAEHPLQVAVRICVRCGNYMCAQCTHDYGAARVEGGAPIERTHCRTCSARVGGGGVFPFSRETWTIDGICSYAFDLFKQHWLTLAAVNAIGLGSVYGFSFATSILQLVMGPKPDSNELGQWPIALAVLSTVGVLVQTLVQVWVQLAMQAVSLDVIRKGRVDLGVALRTIQRVPQALGQMLIIYSPLLLVAAIAGGLFYGLNVETRLGDDLDDLLMPLLWSTPLVLAALTYVGIGLLFMQLPLVDEPRQGALHGIYRSWQLASGERLRILLMMLVMGAVMIAGVLACCIGIIFASGFASLIHASLYLSLKTGRSDVPPALFVQMPPS